MLTRRIGTAVARLTRALWLVTVAGFVCFVTGAWLQFGAGWALMTAGVVLFVAGGLAESRREAV